MFEFFPKKNGKWGGKSLFPYEIALSWPVIRFEAAVFANSPNLVCLVDRIYFSYIFLFLTFLSELTLLHSERPKLYTVLVFLSAIVLN